MTAPFTWYLGMLPPTQMPADEFVVGKLRLRLMGNSLEVSFEGTSTGSADAARALAERYVEALRRRLVTPLWLQTEEEFLARTNPPFGGMVQMISASREDCERTNRAVNEARNELLTNANPALGRAYDYLRRARQDSGMLHTGAMFDLYKAIETIANALGGEAEAGRILGVLKEIKTLKKAANEPTRDERHAPVDPAAPPAPADIGRALENTLVVVRAYEAYLTSRK
jgi:hypothetical protein